MALIYFLRASQLPFHARCSRFCPEAPLGQGNAVNPALGAQRAGVGNPILRRCVQVAGEKAAGIAVTLPGDCILKHVNLEATGALPARALSQPMRRAMISRQLTVPRDA